MPHAYQILTNIIHLCVTERASSVKYPNQVYTSESRDVEKGERGKRGRRRRKTSIPNVPFKLLFDLTFQVYTLYISPTTPNFLRRKQYLYKHFNLLCSAVVNYELLLRFLFYLFFFLFFYFFSFPFLSGKRNWITKVVERCSPLH